ncbi:unnamed protein product [Urochloa decumbens]|uniref:Uncharacterized protein n=1 Tax=Urochloa decumbens TaxID=240449 RepID=A0ABC9APC4_9POAL
MEVVTGALPSLLPKLAALVAGEFNLQKGLKGEIKFLQEELESMKAALEDIFKVPADRLPNQNKIWARNVRELSYDIEDSIDTFMVECKQGKRLGKQRGLKNIIDRSLNLLMQPKIRRKIAAEIRDIKCHVIEVHERRRRYVVNHGVDMSIVDTVDPRLFIQYMEVRELVGMDEARDELINIMTGENEVSMQQGNIVSIVGFGGLGKTTLANAVYEKNRARFHCSACVSVSQTPNMKRLFNGLLYDLGNDISKETLDEGRLIKILREFLQDKRYFIVIDDIWDISVWKRIKCALPHNDVGYKIITTTRNCEVAEHVGGAYKLKPLSLNNSRKLLYRRIFGNENRDNNEHEEKCPSQELAEVSDRILKKCAGVPLAIVTMASLLAFKGRNKMEWYEVYRSIGTGLENNVDVDNMRKILSFSYYELPFHLRSCVLYLSVFPEDYEIDKDRLIRMWIAEGFIQCKIQGKSLIELGESYFNELVNRSVIHPICNNTTNMLSGCRVHDMVLDLIHSMSAEENFIRVLNDMDYTSPLKTIRRLSYQNGMENNVIAQSSRGLQQARSVIVFPSVAAPVLALGSCRVLRVLDLEDCNLSQANSLKYLGNLCHLRYLGLSCTRIEKLPEEIGTMQFLQTLDVRRNEISCLPPTVVQLRNLMRLYIKDSTKVPNGIGNLTCLEELSLLGIRDSTLNTIEELGELTRLRVLRILLDEFNGKLLVCLRKLQNIQHLRIHAPRGQRSIGGLDCWVAPRHLRVLSTQQSCWFSTLPAWLNQSHLQDLSSLCIAVRELHQIHLEILGRLPALRFLDLEVDHENLGIMARFVVGAGSFRCLVRCWLHGFVGTMAFQQGAMQKVRHLLLRSFYLPMVKEMACKDCDQDLGLGNLSSLQDVVVTLQSEVGCIKEARQAAAAMRHAATIHPNHPTHSISVRLRLTEMKIQLMKNELDKRV